MSGPFKVLIVDDSKSVCELLHKQFPPERFTVVGHAHDANSALAAIKKQPIDVAVLDIVLPQASGITVFKEIVRISPDTQVILITDKATPDLIRKLMSQQARYFLVKPIKREVLLLTIQRAMALRSIEIIAPQVPELNFSPLCEDTAKMPQNYISLMDRSELITRAFQLFDSYEEGVIEQLRKFEGERDTIEDKAIKIRSRLEASAGQLANLRFIIENHEKSIEELSRERRARTETVKLLMVEKTAQEREIAELLNRYKTQEENVGYAKLNLDKLKIRLIEKIKYRDRVPPQLAGLQQEVEKVETEVLSTGKIVHALGDKIKLARELLEKIANQRHRLDHETQQGKERGVELQVKLREAAKQEVKLSDAAEKSRRGLEAAEGRVKDFIIKLAPQLDQQQAFDNFHTLHNLCELPQGMLPKRNTLLRELIEAKERHATISEQLRRFMASYTHLRGENEALTNSCNRIVQSRPVLDSKFNELQGLLKNLGEKASAAEKHYRALCQRRDERKVDYMKLKQSQTHLFEELDRLRDEVELAESSLRTFLIKKESLEKDLTQKDNLFNQVERRIVEATNANSRITEKVSVQRREIEKAQAEIASKEQDRGLQQQALVEMERILQQLELKRIQALSAVNRFAEARGYFGQIRGRIEQLLQERFCRKVAIMATDIKGSTSYFERFGDIAGRRMIKTHNELLHPLVQKCGHIFKTKGDSLFAYFEQSRDALDIALAIQRTLRSYNAQAHLDPDQRIRVRIYLHYGTAILEQRPEGLEVYGDVVYTSMKIEEKGGDRAEVIVASRDFYDQFLEDEDLLFRDFGKLAISSEGEALPLYELLWEEMP